MDRWASFPDTIAICARLLESLPSASSTCVYPPAHARAEHLVAAVRCVHAPHLAGLCVQSKLNLCCMSRRYQKNYQVPQTQSIGILVKTPLQCIFFEGDSYFAICGQPACSTLPSEVRPVNFLSRLKEWDIPSHAVIGHPSDAYEETWSHTGNPSVPLRLSKFGIQALHMHQLT